MKNIITLTDIKQNLYNLLGVEAWRGEEGGWDWNNSWIIEEEIYIEGGVTSRELLKYMRERGWLTVHSKGAIEVEFTEYDIVINNRNTREPILAFRPMNPN